jgi:hypothetical protein
VDYVESVTRASDEYYIGREMWVMFAAKLERRVVETGKGNGKWKWEMEMGNGNGKWEWLIRGVEGKNSSV